MRHNLKELTVLVVAGLLVLATGTAVAQETTGALAGSVSDEYGTPIAGATIQAEGAYGRITSVTDETGQYRFPRLTPGAYTVTAQLEGYAESSAEVRVALGEAVTVDFALSSATFEQEVTVYSDTVAIDFTESATASSIREWEIEYLPRGRDFTDVVTFAAGATYDTQAGGISIDGASGLENRYVIDGIDTTDPQDGLSSVPMRAEFMEEVQVKSAGYMAEYGGSTGGVINAVTRSGRNTWHGGLLLDYENMDWNGSARPELEYAPCPQCNLDDGAEAVTYDNDTETRLDPGFFIGGPILRDYLWFFGSYQPGIRNTERTVQWASFDPDTYEQDFQVDYATFNLTANIASSVLLKAGASISPSSTDGLLPNRDGQSDLPDQDDWAPLGQERERETYSLTADWIATDSFVVSGRAGFYHTNTEDTGIPFFDIIHNYSTSNTGEYLENYPEIPANAQNGPGWFSDNLQTGVNAKNIYERTSAGIDASWFVSAAGDHALKGGFQTEEIYNDVQSGYNADRILYYWDQSHTTTEAESVTGTYGVFRLLNISTLGEVKTSNNALFLQDAWSVLPNLTLNLGVRAEAEEVPNYGSTGPANSIEFDYGDKIAPRLGFAWDMFGDSTWKLYGSYGVYYDVTKYEMPRGSFGGDKWVDFWYTFDTPDPYLNDAAGCRTGTNTIAERPDCPAGTFIEASDRRHNSADPDFWEEIGFPLVEPNMKPMESWEAQLGVDWQFTPKIQLGARYVHKEIERTIEDVGLLVPGVGEVYVIANPGEGITTGIGDLPYAKPVREYDALELTFDRRFADNWSLRGYYRLSRLWGNYSGLANSDEQNGFADPLDPLGLVTGDAARLSPNVSRLYDVPGSMYDQNGDFVYGRLATDRTHQLGVQFLYSFNFGFSVGLNQYIGTGTPISTIGGIPTGNLFYPYGRGDLGDTPTLTQTDLTLWQTFNFGRFDLSLGLTVLNLFDEDTATRVYSLRQLQDIEVTDEDFLTGFDFAEKLSELPDSALDSAFNMNDTYQQLRRLRLTVKFEF
jgi:hypothetical protein